VSKYSKKRKRQIEPQESFSSPKQRQGCQICVNISVFIMLLDKVN